MQHTTRLATLMKLSWEIQRSKKHNLMQKQKRTRKKRSIRSFALEAAWSIFLNEDITIYYLVKRHSHEKYPNKVQPQNLGLFQHL